MNNRTRVVVYGNTLSMAGIAASLKAEASLEILCVDPRDPTTRQTLNELDLQAIIYDRSDPHTVLDLSLMREQPGLLLVGVDPSSNEVLVLTSKRNKVMTASELAHLMSNHTALSKEGQEHS